MGLSTLSAIRSVQLGFAVGLFCGCTTAPETPAMSPAQALIGRSKEALLVCAGRPLKEIPTRGGLLLKYYKEASMFEESFVGSKGSIPGIHHGCWATISIQEERVIGVEYKSTTTPGIHDDHCDEIFENCAQ